MRRYTKLTEAVETSLDELGDKLRAAQDALREADILRAATLMTVGGFDDPAEADDPTEADDPGRRYHAVGGLVTGDDEETFLVFNDPMSFSQAREEFVQELWGRAVRGGCLRPGDRVLITRVVSSRTPLDVVEPCR
jgi:hypothetical protein